MPLIATPDAASSPPCTDAANTHSGELSPETKDALLARAKEIIAGRLRPEPMVPTPEIEEFLRREFEGCEPPPTAEALRFIIDHHCLETIYRGQPVLCFTSPEKAIIVLASGVQDIFTVRDALTDDERQKVIIEYTDQSLGWRF